jgi:hypothetical protein
MRWVSHPSYRGLDRRERRRGWRCLERRRLDHAGAAPALITALRQLRHAAPDLSTAARLDSFAQQVESVAVLALTARHNRAANLLHDLAARLRLPGIPQCDAILAALQSAQILIAEGDAS